MLRHATAVWNGSGKEGNGTISTESGAIKEVSYNYRKRFETEPGTNPEELIAAAHASCFSMKLSFVLGESGITPEKLETKCEITFEGGVVKKSHLTVKGTVPGIDEAKWQEAVTKAKENCPISKALNTEITAEGNLG